MNSREFLATYTTIQALLRDPEVQSRFTNGKQQADSLYLRVEDTLPMVIELYLNEVTDALSRAPKLLAIPTDFSTTAPFEELAKFYGRNSADLIRSWFKDLEGGYDTSTVEDRKAIYSKARNHYESKSTTTTNGSSGNAPSNPRPTVVKTEDKPKRKSGPCPDCTDAGETTRQVTTKYGQRYRCDTHDYWGNA